MPSHPKRLHLLATIRQRPGLGFRELMRASGLTNGTCQHHVSLLLRRELITVRTWANRQCHFPAGHKIGPSALAATRPELDRLLSWLRQGHEPVTQGAIIGAFPDWPRNTTRNRLARLVHLGAITKERRPRSVLYRVAAPESRITAQTYIHSRVHAT